MTQPLNQSNIEAKLQAAADAQTTIDDIREELEDILVTIGRQVTKTNLSSITDIEFGEGYLNVLGEGHCWGRFSESFTVSWHEVIERWKNK